HTCHSVAKQAHRPNSSRQRILLIRGNDFVANLSNHFVETGKIRTLLFEKDKGHFSCKNPMYPGMENVISRINDVIFREPDLHVLRQRLKLTFELLPSCGECVHYVHCAFRVCYAVPYHAMSDRDIGMLGQSICAFQAL